MKYVYWIVHQYKVQWWQRPLKTKKRPKHFAVLLVNCWIIFLLHFLYFFSSTWWLQTKSIRCNGGCRWTCSDGMSAPKRSPWTHYIMEKRWHSYRWQRWENYSKYKTVLQTTQKLTNLELLISWACGPPGSALLFLRGVRILWKWNLIYLSVSYNFLAFYPPTNFLQPVISSFFGWKEELLVV